jgi:RNA 3'-terminal phosphate cyclase (ATP)
VDHVSQHTLTNAEVIARFLPVTFTFDAGERHSTVRIDTVR